MPILFNLKLISFPYISFAIEPASFPATAPAAPARAFCPCMAARAAFAAAWAAAFPMPSSSPERCPITSATYGAAAPASAALRSPPALFGGTQGGGVLHGVLLRNLAFGAGNVRHLVAGIADKLRLVEPALLARFVEDNADKLMSFSEGNACLHQRPELRFVIPMIAIGQGNDLLTNQPLLIVAVTQTFFIFLAQRIILHNGPNQLDESC